MTEKTETDKMEANFKAQMVQQKETFEQQFSLAMKLTDARICELRESFEDRKKELLTQNDGLLGAVGRLHGEVEALRHENSQLKSSLEKTRADTERFHKEAQITVDRILSEATREVNVLKDKLAKYEKKK